MQCNNSFYGTIPLNAQTLNGQCSSYPPLLQNNIQYPEVIGEGDVTSVLLPNGSVQLYFIPTPRRDLWTSYIYKPDTLYRNWNSNAGVWFVRNISYPFPSYGSNDQIPYSYGDTQTRWNFNTNVPPCFTFLNKFHNDNWTSTTDLHYFCPSLRKATASVQIETPNVANTVCHYQVVCGKPCVCCNDSKAKSVTEYPKGSECCMSCDDMKPKEIERKRKTKKRALTAKNSSSEQCSCQKGTSDKLITTYNDQACGSEVGRGTSANKNRENEREKKLLKTRCKKVKKTKSPLVLDFCENCCPGRCCVTDTDEDM